MSHDAPFCYDFPRPAVAVDIVLLHWQSDLSIVLIQRKNPPFANTWALPGGFMEPTETATAAARRELQEETTLSVEKLTLCGEFSQPDRDPRTRVLSLVFTAFLTELKPVVGQDDAQTAAWFPLSALPPLAFDHGKIINSALGFWQQQLALATGTNLTLPPTIKSASLGLFPQSWPLQNFQQLANYFHSYTTPS